MTWRRFLALIRGLSPMSAFLNAQGSPQSTSAHSQHGMIEDTAEGERAVLSLLRGG